ncbi:hypothetical protein [Gemmiger sp.]
MKKFKRFCYRILPVALCAAMLGGCRCLCCILFGCGEHRFHGQRAAQGHGQFLPDV